MDKIYIRLEIIGITYNQIEKGVYALILQEVNGKRRLPIAIGTAEAQSIECKLQEIITPRPLTHDLMANVFRAFGIGLTSVVIKQLPGGIFAADLIMTDGERRIEIDSRSSDAIALALRMNVPILTTNELLDSVGFVRERGNKYEDSSAATDGVRCFSSPGLMSSSEDSQLSSVPVDQLESMLAQASADEEYELAAQIKKELDKRKKL